MKSNKNGSSPIPNAPGGQNISQTNNVFVSLNSLQPRSTQNNNIRQLPQIAIQPNSTQIPIQTTQVPSQNTQTPSQTTQPPSQNLNSTPFTPPKFNEDVNPTKKRKSNYIAQKDSDALLRLWALIDNETKYFENKEVKELMEKIGKTSTQIKTHIMNKKKKATEKSTSNEGKKLREEIRNSQSTVDLTPDPDPVEELSTEEKLSILNDEIDLEDVATSEQSFEEIKKKVQEKRQKYKDSLGSTKLLKQKQIEDIKLQREERKKYQETQTMFQMYLMKTIEESKKSEKEEKIEERLTKLENENKMVNQKLDTILTLLQNQK